MKDFAKSIVCNTKAEAEKVGNFEDPKKAKYYIEMWERRRDDAKRSLQNAEGHLKEAMKHRYGDKEFNQREVQRYQEAVKAAEATIKQYDDLIKSAAKTSFGNTRTGNSNKAEIIEKKKKEGATLKVDNGQKLEFSDGSTYVKTSFSDDYREAHNYTGNSRTGNSYNWEERRGHQELYDPTFPFGGHVRGYVEKTKNGYVGAKTNGSIVIKQKEFATEAEAKKFVENKQTGNDTPWEYATRKPKVINDDKTGAEEFFKKLSDDVKEREKKDDKEIEKVGNKEYSTDDFKRIKEEALRIAQTTKDEEKKKRALKIADYMKYAHNQPDWGKIVDRYDQELKQIGNSASDDKFAYVMREFDEGKLKTPDGKVVTDPAQAKAIAYSESKKTENGLARARNAMNKKCGNSQVTLWKGNDSVLISEDGTVQYLESNSFETDRDKYGSMQEAIDDLTKKGYRKK